MQVAIDAPEEVADRNAKEWFDAEFADIFGEGSEKACGEDCDDCDEVGTKAAPNCGTGAGGFKPGNDCNRFSQDGGGAADTGGSAAKQDEVKWAPTTATEMHAAEAELQRFGYNEEGFTEMEEAANKLNTYSSDDQDFHERTLVGSQRLEDAMDGNDLLADAVEDYTRGEYDDMTNMARKHALNRDFVPSFAKRVEKLSEVVATLDEAIERFESGDGIVPEELPEELKGRVIQSLAELGKETRRAERVMQKLGKQGFHFASDELDSAIQRIGSFTYGDMLDIPEHFEDVERGIFNSIDVEGKDLRRAAMQLGRLNQKPIQLLDKYNALNEAVRAPLTTDGRPVSVFRGWNTSKTFLARELASSDEFTFDSLTSTSASPSTARNFGRGGDLHSVYMTLFARTGQYIAPLSAHGGELEILQPAGTRYRVMSRKRTKRPNGGWAYHIIAEEVVDED